MRDDRTDEDTGVACRFLEELEGEIEIVVIFRCPEVAVGVVDAAFADQAAFLVNVPWICSVDDPAGQVFPVEEVLLHRL